ncbi:MAG TPA: short-chain dehydrogenase [Candidatus Xenobia bacterium]
MNIENTTVLVLGGAGMVGMAVCRELLEERPRRLIVHALHRERMQEAVAGLQAELDRRNRLGGKAIKVAFAGEWGNVMLRDGLHTRNMAEVLASPEDRRTLIQDVLEEPASESDTRVLRRFWLYQLVHRHTPDIVIDCINTATAIAYTDLHSAARQAARSLIDGPPDLDVLERVLAGLYVPQLIRHIQVLYRSMQDVGTRMYLKVGTSGTGGMGLNIPYTHGEERPSRTLLSKSAVAGAQTMLLFLQARTPGAPITKEIKPTAAVGWKHIGAGKVLEKGRPIPLQDCLPDQAMPLDHTLKLDDPAWERRVGGDLESVYVDMGENGYFAFEEFTAITTSGQMEFVTPEEIARTLVLEIQGSNTGFDVINVLNDASLGPSYRAGFLREPALRRMRDLKTRHPAPSVAFEMLGPPRLSKLLFECWLLSCCYTDMEAVAHAAPSDMVERLEAYVTQHPEARTPILSIGIPILLSDGKRLLRGRRVKTPAAKGGLKEVSLENPERLETWIHEGWVDLRLTNMEKWRDRMRLIMEEARSIAESETSSRYIRNQAWWSGADGKPWTILPGEIAGWILNIEEQGMRGRE